MSAFYAIPTVVHSGPYHASPKLHKYHKAERFNILVVALTAFVFFAVLAFYTFLLQLYRYYIGYNSEAPKEKRRILKKNALSAFGFLVIWLLVVAIFYFAMVSTNRIRSSRSQGYSKLEHPPISEETRL